MTKKTCGIHQPNFFPWLGYFDKMKQSDVFIFLDDVAYPKSGSGMGAWTNRVKVNIQGRAAWVTCPVQRMPGIQPIKTVEIDNSQHWKKKLFKTLEINYKKAPEYTWAMDFLTPLINHSSDNLAEYNIAAITAISLKLGIKTRYIRQSELFSEHELKSTALLINLAKSVEAATYLAGGGSQGYQQDDLFEKEGLDLRYQNFKPTSYGGHAHWLAGLSVIDYLMWIGADSEGFGSD